MDRKYTRIYRKCTKPNIGGCGWLGARGCGRRGGPGGSAIVSSALSVILECRRCLFPTQRGSVCLVSSWSGFFQPSFVQIISMQRRAAWYLHDLVVNMVKC